MNLQCPACENKLSKIFINDKVIDVCQGGCAGIWLDINEMSKIEENKLESEILLKLKKNPKFTINLSKQRFCPKCNQVKLEKQIENKVTIDECPKCEGIWLDSNELFAFVKIEAAQPKINQSEIESYNRLRKIFRG